MLRGPQGTLYGRNTHRRRAIKYVTKEIGDDPISTSRAEYGSYNHQD